MTLRLRTQLIIGFALLGLLCVLFTVIRFSLQRGFSRVEQKLDARFALVERDDTHKNMQRAVDALNSCVDNLASKNADWAQWDDTYRYVEDLNAHYARSNLTEQALSALKINYMGIVNTSGRILFSFTFDLVTQKSSALAPGVERRIIHEYGLLHHTDPHGLIAGIVETQQGLMIAASRPIVTSDAQGPIRGTIIFGQFLNDSAIAGLSRITHQNIDIALNSDTASTEDFKRARGAISLQGRVIVQAPNSDSIFGYTALRDVRNKPVALIRVGLPREIYRQGRQTLLEVRAQGHNTLITVLIGVSVVGVVLGAIILIILELQVLSRLKRLSMSAGHIGDSKDFSARVTVEGTDELSSVSMSMNRMLDSLAQTHHQLKRRTTEMHLLMASVPVGLLSLDERLLINPEYSRSAESILGLTDLAGRRYIDVLGLSSGSPREEDGAKCEEFLGLLCKEALPEKEMAALNPLETLELTSGSKPKWIHLSYHLIRRGGGDSNHMLVVMEDISEAKSLEEEVIRSQQENLQLKAIVEEPELFREFIAEAKTMVASARRLASSLTRHDSPHGESAEIFRLIHTIKGIAGAFALRHITGLAGNAEECLSSMRNHATPQSLAVLQDTLSMLEQAIDEVKKLTSSITGDDADDGGGMSLRISLAELKRHIAAIEAMDTTGQIKEAMVRQAKENIIRRLTSLKLVPASKGLGKAVKVVPDLIRRMGKDACFTFKGKDIPIDCEIAQELSGPLVHLLRNAIDHGLETPDERSLAGKPRQGELTLSVYTDKEDLVMEIIDDGKGMDPQHLKETALRKNFLSAREAQTLTSAECYNLILKPGFTTKSEVTDVSGRGVGLDVVVHSVKNKLNGQIHIESQVGKGSRFTLRIPVYKK